MPSPKVKKLTDQVNLNGQVRCWRMGGRCSTSLWIGSGSCGTQQRRTASATALTRAQPSGMRWSELPLLPIPLRRTLDA